jgi:probable rRNA maturation factor
MMNDEERRRASSIHDLVPMLLNRQQQCALNLPVLRIFARKLRRALGLGRRDFNVCFVDDGEIERLNAAFRGKRLPTDVLSFPWKHEEGGSPARPRQAAVMRPIGDRQLSRREGRDVDLPGEGEFKGFLGDIVISVETARRNARKEGHSTLNELRWLILHGVLHLLGYNHDINQGEMTRRELALRQRLGITASTLRRNLKKRPRLSHG